MRPATTELVERLYKDHYGPFQEPIIDLGGAETNRQFSHLFKYQIVDWRPLDEVDIQIDARVMWSSGIIKTHSIGTVLTFDTLEHIYEVQEVVHQIAMITIKGGRVIVGVPWMYPFHDPSGDYWRFSHQALERLFSEWFDTLMCGYYDDDGKNQYIASYFVGRRKMENRDISDNRRL